MPIAEDSTATRADPALHQIHAAPALVAVGEDLRAPEDFVFRHRSYKMPSLAANARRPIWHRYIPPMASSSTTGTSLPIEHVLAELRAVLAMSPSVVLLAPPGAGKTTRVPLALRDEPWLAGRGILVLEPRRLATRAAARRMASTLGESVGGTIGFRVRGETRVGASTRIEVVTEGVLTRMLLDDPTLERVGAVLFDEFHERNLNADFGLALALQTQAVLRPALRILVMSATLDGAPVAALMGGAPIVVSHGRQHPVELRYRPSTSGAPVVDSVARAIREALVDDEGSILAFLPGAGEIRRCVAALERSSLPDNVWLLPLYGDLAARAQDAAIAPAPPGIRKVVLATSIAETSLTIDGVRIVIDSGVSRVARFSPRTGMSRLETVRVSRSSADQRSGRAGRTAAGVSYRLWAQEHDAHLSNVARAEVLEADLAPLALDLAIAGILDPSELRWLDPPPTPALSHARALLRQLGALTADNRPTGHGMAMAAFGLHPRLSHMLLAARDRGLGATASAIASLLEERDVLLRSGMRPDIDLRSRVAILADGARDQGVGIDHDAVRRVHAQARVWREQLGISSGERIDVSMTGRLLAFAYPDRVAQRRAGEGGRYLMRNGAGAVAEDPGVLAGEAFLVIADLDGRAPHSRIYLAAPLDRTDLDEIFSADVEHDDILTWDASNGTANGVRRSHLGGIVLKEVPLRDVDAEALADLLLDAIARKDGVALSWTDAVRRLQARVMFVQAFDSGWPDFGDAALSATMSEWLRPHLIGARRRSDIERLDLTGILFGLLTWTQRQQLDELAPTHLVVPTGSRIPVDYTDPSAPTIAVRLQELFGLADTPCVGVTRVPVTLQLLSPAHRPVQVTRDLAGFWRSSYFAVRKDLRGRYPKHEWPEDPMSALPTSRAKPRGK